MNIKNVFKKLILLNFGVLILTAVLVFFESEEVVIFNERMFASSDVLLIISLIWVLVYIVNLYFLYNFKEVGKKIFLFLFISNLILSMFFGSSAVDPVAYVLEGLSWSANAAILVFLYFTPISKHFK